MGSLVVRVGNVHIPVQWAGLSQIFAQMVDLRNGRDNIRSNSMEEPMEDSGCTVAKTPKRRRRIRNSELREDVLNKSNCKVRTVSRYTVSGSPRTLLRIRVIGFSPKDMWWTTWDKLVIACPVRHREKHEVGGRGDSFYNCRYMSIRMSA